MLATSVSLSLGPEFLWGAVGGAAGAALIFVTPWLVKVYEKAELPGWPKVLGGLGLLLAHGTFGGLAAIIVGHAAGPGQAIVFGIGWPGVLKGTGQSLGAVSEATARKPDTPPSAAGTETDASPTSAGDAAPQSSGDPTDSTEDQS
jgi:hypothetical protein